MDPIYLLSLANPIIAGLFSLTFYWVWRRQPERRYVFAWSLVYLAASVGWGIEFLRVFFGDVWVSFATNLVLPFVALFTAKGVCLRYQGTSPDRLLFLIYGVSIALSSYFSLVPGDVFWRGTFISSGMAIMLAVGLNAMLWTSNRDHIDHGIALALGLVAIVLMVRPAISVMIEGPPPVEGALPESFWIVSVKLVALFSWISFAIIFLVRIAADLMQELADRSVTDDLSGVLNRRGFFEKAGPVLDQASAALPVVVLICDIDRFKKINDTHGHGVGDRVIQGLANVLRRAAGESGIVGRLGGEEFAVVLPKTDLRAALLFAEGVRTAFAHEAHDGVPPSRPTTMSVGLSESWGAEALDTVLDRADAALYRAKRSGRNRVESSGPPRQDTTGCRAA